MADRARGVFAISVAAEMVSMQVQNLRLYRQDDVDRLHHIRDLLAEGLNLAGIARVLELDEEVRRLRGQVARLEAHRRD